MQPLPVPLIDVVIPAYNEEASIALVIADLPQHMLRHIVVADNASTDQTADAAREAGAVVVPVSRRGYGSACLGGIAWLAAQSIAPQIIVFCDGDYSDHPEELPMLIRPIVTEGKDLVIGSRKLGNRQPGAMLIQQRLGNWLASVLMRALYGFTYTDLGPFRAITWQALTSLQMADTTYGWTVEMQVKAIKKKMSIAEVPVSYRRRVGVSKIAGTLKGTVLAGYKIIKTIIRYA